MINILWADDQQDVVKTMSGVFDSIDARIAYAQNGVAAMDRLKRQHYDVIILDLLMPPDKWGGLWVLEHIGKTGIQVPVIVLSGEGAQEETIKAMRLGAKDYVLKDKVEHELVQRVLAITAESARALDERVTKSLPTPIALPYRRYLNACEPASQLRQLIKFYEFTLRFCAITGICDLEARGDIHNRLGWASQLLRGPSMGSWNHIRHSLAKWLPAGSAFFQLHHSFDNSTVNSIIQLRNDLAHGIDPSPRVARRQLEEHAPRLRRLLGRLCQSVTLRLFVPLDLHFDGVEFEMQGTLIAGDSVAFPKLTLTASEPMACDQVHLLEDVDSIDSRLNLFPFVILEPSEEPDVWRILLFDRLTTRSAVNEVPIGYVDMWSGERDVIPDVKPTGRLLPSYLRREVSGAKRQGDSTPTA